MNPLARAILVCEILGIWLRLSLVYCNTKDKPLQTSVCFFVLCNRHWFNKAPSAFPSCFKLLPTVPVEGPGMGNACTLLAIDSAGGLQCCGRSEVISRKHSPAGA
jgi:hypothetical protein